MRRAVLFTLAFASSTAFLAILAACGNLSPANVQSNEERLRRYVETHDLPPARREALQEERVIKGMTEEEVYLVVSASPYWSSDPARIDTLQTGHQIRVYESPTSDYGPLRMQLNDSLRVVTVRDPTQ